MRGVRRALNVALGAVLLGLLAGVVAPFLAGVIGLDLDRRAGWLVFIAFWALVLAIGKLWWVRGELYEHWCGRCGRLREPSTWREPDEPDPEEVHSVRLVMCRHCPRCAAAGCLLCSGWLPPRRPGAA